MDTRRTVTIDLPEPLLLALGRVARAAGCSPSAYLRAALRSALDRTPGRTRTEEEEILCAVHLAADWLDLQRRLRTLGFVLRRAPEGLLTVHTWPVERALAPLHALGPGEVALTLRFGAGFPADMPRGLPHPRPARLGRAA